MTVPRTTRALVRCLRWLKRRIVAEWQGPAALPRSLTLEWRLMAARWVGILFIAPAVPLLGLSANRLLAASLIVLAGVIYNLTVRWYLQRRPRRATAYVTTLADSLLSAAMVAVGGGFDSSFGYFLFTIVITVAMRYGYGPSMAAIAVFVSLDALEQLSQGQNLDGPFAFRAGFLTITGLLASYLRRMTERAEMALQDRLVELQRLYADLAIAHQDLLSLDEAKTNFLANVSHELRTPLTSIRAFSEMLLSYDDSDAVKREFVEIISNESERLTRLVNDVLDVTKIEAGQMDWRDELLEVRTILDQCHRTYAPLVDQSKLVFNYVLPANLPRVRGDRDRLQQVIHNLLTNALKFTAYGSITLRAARHADTDEISISLSDTGVGIASADQTRVFEKFQQVGDTLTGKPTGTGLGLTICRDIILHHGGRMTLASEPGLGSTFTIWLPIARPAELAA